MFRIARHSTLRQVRTCPRPLNSFFRSQQTPINRLLSTLAVLEQREGKLQDQSLSTVTAARKLGGSITGFVAGSNIKPVAEQAAKVDGVEKIFMVENGDYDKVRDYSLSIRYETRLLMNAIGSARKLRSPSCREH